MAGDKMTREWQNDWEWLVTNWLGNDKMTGNGWCRLDSRKNLLMLRCKSIATVSILLYDSEMADAWLMRNWCFKWSCDAWAGARLVLQMKPWCMINARLILPTRLWCMAGVRLILQMRLWSIAIQDWYYKRGCDAWLVCDWYYKWDCEA